MSIYEKILVSIMVFNAISWFAFLQPNSFIIWASLRAGKFTPLGIWYVVCFWTSVICTPLLAFDIIWSVF